MNHQSIKSGIRFGHSAAPERVPRRRSRKACSQLTSLAAAEPYVYYQAGGRSTVSVRPSS
jgi:hypothetical protein